MAEALPPLEPTRDPRVTLPDLLEVLLNKGVILHLDLIVAVADIPLIGVSVKAAIAGIETMLEYGMMRKWDADTRAWVQRSISRSVPFLEGEELIARMAGGHEHQGLYTTWRPGTLYLTNRRLFVFRREPAEMLFETPLERIEALALEPDRSVGGEERFRLRLCLSDGSETRLSAMEPERIASLVREQLEGLGRALPLSPVSSRITDVLREGQVWYHEPRSGGGVWRGGVLRLHRRDGLTWKSPLDARPAIAIGPGDIRGLRLETGRTPGGAWILVVETDDDLLRIATEDAHAWSQAILGLMEARLAAIAEEGAEGAGAGEGGDAGGAGDGAHG